MKKYILLLSITLGFIYFNFMSYDYITINIYLKDYHGWVVMMSCDTLGMDTTLQNLKKTEYHVKINEDGLGVVFLPNLLDLRKRNLRTQIKVFDNNGYDIRNNLIFVSFSAIILADVKQFDSLSKEQLKQYGTLEFYNPTSKEMKLYHKDKINDFLDFHSKIREKLLSEEKQIQYFLEKCKCKK